MLNWLKKWRTTEEERQQERVTAYVDDALTAVEKRAFEQELAQDAALRQAVAAEQDLKVTLAQLPRLRAPRNFTLDTAVYATQPRATLALDWYPRLRTATAVVGFLLVGIFALNLLAPPTASDMALPMMSQSQEVAVMQDEAIAPEALRVMPEAGDAAPADEMPPELALESETAGEASTNEEDLALFALLDEEEAEMAETTEAEEIMPADSPPVLTPLPTAVVVPPPADPEPAPLDLWQISQLSLLMLFLTLLTATLLTRRRL